MATMFRPTFNRLLFLAACAVAPLAHADIFGYVDADGETHFATQKLDPRYTLYIKGDGVFDSGEVRADGAVARSRFSEAITRHPNLKKYEALVIAAAAEFKVDVALMKAVMAAESGFNPTAVSPKGAIGLMQIMPATAERYGVAGDARRSIQQKLTDPQTNVRLAARYLRDLNALFPNQQPLVIASYNAGEGAVQKYKNTVPPYPETRNYVQLVTQFYQVFMPVAASPALANATGRRIHLTIPGRSNMPEPLTSAN
jgi:soluble lytic murein transglycosylase-like protein